MATTAEELLLQINGDSAGGQAAVQQLADLLSNALARGLKDTSAGADGVSTSSDQASSKLSGLAKYIQDLKPSTDNASKGFMDLKSTLTEMWDNPTKAVGDFSTMLGTELTSSLGGSETALGSAVVGVGIFAGGLAAAGAIAGDLAEKAVAVGESLQDFSYKTSISVESASELSYAATVAGSSLDQVGSAIFMMQKRMADDSTGKFAEALGQIGLSVEQIQSLTPDQQFLKIAAAFAENTTQADRASVAMALFGRAGRDLAPLLMKDLGDLTTQAAELGHVMSGETAKGLEDLGMTWRGFKEDVSWTTTEVGVGVVHFFQDVGTGINEAFYLLDPFAEDVETVGKRLEGMLPKVKDITAQLVMSNGQITMSADDQKAAEKDLTDQINAHIDAAKRQQAAIDSVKASLEGDTKMITAQVAALDQLIASGITDEDVKTRVLDLITKLEEKHITLTDRIYAWDDAQKQLLTSINTSSTALERYDAVVDLANQTGESFSGIARAMRDDAYGLGEALPTARFSDLHAVLTGVDDATGNLASDDLPAATGSLTDFSGAMAAADANLKQTLVDFRNSPDDIGLFDEAIAGLPNALQRAFEGGGNVGKALGSTIGKNMGSALEESLLEQEGTSDTGDSALTTIFGDKIGGALTAALPVVGSLIGPLISKLFSIGGPSQEEVQGRQTEGQFEDQMGGIAGIGQALTNAGLTADAANAKIQALFAAEKSGSAAVQTQIDSINAVISQHATDVSTAVSGILTAAQTVGGKVPTALQPLLTALSTAGSLTDDEKNSLLGLATAGDPSFSDLSAAAGRYGLTLDTIGGKAAQLSISTEADQIEQDYDTLVTKGGADSDKVLAGMKTSLNDLVNHALDAGDVLPTAIQPLIDQLLKTGQLTDDAGNAITDLSKLKFDDTGDPLSTGLKSLTDAITHLSDLLSPTSPDGLPAQATAGAAAIGAALGTVKAPTIPIHFSLDDPYGAAGVAAIPMAAGGSFRVTRPTLFLAGEAGDEDVAFSGGGRSFPGGASGGTGVVVNVNVEGNVWTETDLADAMMQHIADAVQLSSALPYGVRR